MKYSFYNNFRPIASRCVDTVVRGIKESIYYISNPQLATNLDYEEDLLIEAAEIKRRYNEAKGC